MYRTPFASDVRIPGKRSARNTRERGGIMQEDMQERQRRAERIEALIQEVNEFSDPHARAIAEELVQSLLDLYGEGLARILELTVQAGAPGYKIVESLAGDELGGSFVILH